MASNMSTSRCANHFAGIRHRTHFFVEHAIAKFLRAAHVGGGARQPDLERAEPPEVRAVCEIASRGRSPL